MAAGYAFESVWRIPAPPERCWAELERMLHEGAVEWWPAVRVADAPRTARAGEPLVLVVRSPLGYRLRARLQITRSEPGRALAARSTGDLVGEGRVEVRGHAGGSILAFRWEVATTRRWMNAAAPLLRGAFAAAHDRVMRDGEAGLRRAVAR